MKEVYSINGNIEYAIFDKHTAIPDLNEQLISLYETPWCDPVYLEINEPSFSVANCYKLFLYENGFLKHLLLLQNRGKRKLRVWNYCFKISIQDIEIIRNIIFSECKPVKIITFRNLFLDIVEKTPLMITFKTMSDMIIELPESMDAYMKSLGSTTRKSLRNSHNRIEKDKLDFKISYFEKENITREQIVSLVELNRDRMKGKWIVSDNTNTEIERLIRYARICGVMCLSTVDEKIVGGTLMTVLGNHGFSNVTGFDNAYNKYSIGSIVSINEVRYMIETQRKFLHLLWGEQDYKKRFNAELHNIYDVIVFKKRIVFFLFSILYDVRTMYTKIKNRLKQNVKFSEVFNKIRYKLREKTIEK